MPLVQQAFAQLPAGVVDAKLTLPAAITLGNPVIFVGAAVSPDGDTSDMSWAWEGGTPIDTQTGMWECVASLGGGAFAIQSAFYSTFTDTGLRTMEISTGTETLTLFVFEWTGMVAYPQIDDTVELAATGTGTDANSGSTAALNTELSLVITASSQFSGAPVAVTLPVGHTGITELADPSVSPPMVVSYQVITSTAAQSATFTYASSVLWMTGITAFKLEEGWQPEPPAPYPPGRGGKLRVSLLTRQPQAGQTWRLRGANGEALGRIWNGQHVLRLLRDADLAEQIDGILALEGAERRQAARQAIQAWNAAGGRGESLGSLVASPLNDAGVDDGNTHLYLDDQEIGYFHGVAPAKVTRVLRFVRLAEDVADAEALETPAERNQALDAAVIRFRDNGAISDG